MSLLYNGKLNLIIMIIKTVKRPCFIKNTGIWILLYRTNTRQYEGIFTENKFTNRPLIRDLSFLELS